jgi:hypothetical protein
VVRWQLLGALLWRAGARQIFDRGRREICPAPGRSWTHLGITARRWRQLPRAGKSGAWRGSLVPSGLRELSLTSPGQSSELDLEALG